MTLIDPFPTWEIQLFEVFEHMLDRNENEMVPYIFKTVIFILITSRTKGSRDADLCIVRDFVTVNLVRSLNAYSSIPVDELIEPLLRQLGKEGVQSMDFALLGAIVNHKQVRSLSLSALIDSCDFISTLN
jgi:hypothetical protein